MANKNSPSIKIVLLQINVNETIEAEILPRYFHTKQVHTI